MEDMKKAVKHFGEAKKILDKWSNSKSGNSTEGKSPRGNSTTSATTTTTPPIKSYPNLEHALLSLYLGVAKATQNLVDDAKKFFDESKTIVEQNMEITPVSIATSTTTTTTTTTTMSTTNSPASTTTPASTSTSTSSTTSGTSPSTSPSTSTLSVSEKSRRASYPCVQDDGPHPILIQLFRHRADVCAAAEGLDEGVRCGNRSLMMLLKYTTLTPPNVRARAFEHVADFCAKIGTSEEERTDGIPSTHAQTMTSKAILYYSQAMSLLTNKAPTLGPDIPQTESPLFEIDFTIDKEDGEEDETPKEPAEGGLLEQQRLQEQDVEAEVASIEAKLKYLQETAESPAIGKDQCIFS